MRIAIYARVSTPDRDQNPETQLLPLREFVQAQDWQTYQVYVDEASAMDLNGRKAWRDLLDDASKRRFDLLLVWRMDRAFVRCWTPQRPLKGSGPRALVSDRTQSPGWIRRPSSVRLFTTSPSHMHSSNGASFGRGLRPAWSEHAVRARE